jgi:hypothetical protein
MWRGSLRLTRWTAVAIVAGLIIVSLLLRLHGYRFYYWVDEGLSVGIASHPLRHIPSLLREDGSPPLYYMLLHVWMSIRGTSEIATHQLSLLFALLTVPVAYWGGSSLFGRRVGLVCAVLATGLPYLTQYSEETRMYALLTLLTLIVAIAFVHAFVFRRRRYLPVFSIALVASLYTHNWSLFLGLMTAAAFLVCVRGGPAEERRSLWRDGAIAFGVVALLYAPWLPTLAYQAKHTGAPWSLPPVVWSLSHSAYTLVGGRGAAMALLLGGGAGLVTLHRAEPTERRVVLGAISLLMLGLGTLLVAWIYAKVTPAWADRYLAVIVGPLLLLFGLGVARSGRLGLVALALVSCFWVLDPLAASRDTKSNVATVAAHLRPELGPGALVLSTQPEQVPTLAVYLPRVTRFGTPLGPTADPRVVDWRDALSHLRHASVKTTLMPMVDTLASGQRVLLVLSTGLPKSPLWMKLINLDNLRWTRALNRDPQLKRMGTSSAAAAYAGVPVRAVLYVKR